MLRSLLSYSLFFSVIIACDNNNQTTTSTESSSKDSIQIDTLPVLSLPLEILEQEEVLDESTLTRADGYSFLGKIDNKYSVEMLLIPTKDNGNNCKILSGDYSYTSSQSSISLDGEICFDQQKINLQHHKEGILKEQFEGTFTANLNTIQGTWTKPKKKQELSFELHNLMNQRNTKLFATALSSTLADNAEAPSAQDIGYDDKGIYIQSLYGSHLDYEFFPGNFSADSWYSSTARNSDYTTAVYLHKVSFKDDYVAIVLEESHTEYYEEGKDNEEAPEVTQEKTYSVWMYQGDTIVNIFAPKDIPSQHPIYATLKGNTLVIIDQASQKEEKL
jgi:hypothetical protein